MFWNGNMFSRCKLIVQICLSCCIVSTQLVSAPLPTVSEVISSYRASLEKIRMTSVHYEFMRENDELGSVFHVKTGKGNYWGMYQEKTPPDVKGEVSATTKNSIRGSINLGGMIPEENVKEGDVKYVLESHKSPTKGPAEYFFNNFGCGYFWGYVSDEDGETVDILELLSKCKLEVKTDQINQNNVLLLSGTWGLENQVRVWFDHFPECNVVRAEVSFPKSQPGNVYYSQYTVEEFMNKDGSAFPFRYTEHIKTKGGEAKGVDSSQPVLFQPVDTRLGYRMNSVDIGETFTEAGFELSFISEIPDNTPVFMVDAPHIEHIWLDGKIVPKTDENVLALLRGHKFMPGPDKPRFWGMAIGIILIVISLGIMAYKHFTGKK